MSIIKYHPEIPDDLAIVYADNGEQKDRCVFENGKFIGGGDFPIPPYELKNVKRWFYYYEYTDYHEGQSCFISFSVAALL